MMRILAKRLLTPLGFVDHQTVTVENGLIADIAPDMGAADAIAPVLTPGLIDLHNHGGNGFDTKSSTLAEMRVFLSRMLSCGVTDMLMTVSTGDRERIRKGLALVSEAMRLQKARELPGTHIQGVHLEGPFLSPKRPGAMAVAQMQAPSVEAFEATCAPYIDIIREVTLAPEEEGAQELIDYLVRRGIRVQAGHTDASYEAAKASFVKGVGSLCHTFNACRPIHHREPGIVTAALLDDTVYCEAICDMVHLHQGTIALIYRCKGPDRMIIVSDSTKPHEMPDGEYRSGQHAYIVTNGVARTVSGSLSGGSAYMDAEIRNLISIGIDPADAYTMGTATPAKWMGFDALGTVEPGKAAHLSAFDEHFMPIFTVLDGVIYK